MLREFQRAELAEALKPETDVMPAIRDTDELAADLLEIPVGIVSQGVPFAKRECPEARAQFVPPCPDGLERRAGREADLALDAVHLDGGGEPITVLVDALGDARPAAG
ncbi:MAG: hypothetical protein OXG35_30255 [Acidobacteria bacterium]|nr:hypothetical protein [Acidobacteriota bacterium]